MNQTEPQRSTGARRRARGLLLRAALLALSLLVGLFFVEGLLFSIGSPRRIHAQVANPPHLRMDVEMEEFSYVWETNDQGLRYPEIPLRKPAGETRVFVVGDSFTDGEGVAVADRFTDRLERSFGGTGRRVRFVNAGLGGQGVLQYARLFHWVGTRYEPDGLLICINANDLADARPRSTRRDIEDVERLPPRGWQTWAHRLWPRLWCRIQLALDAADATEFAVEDPAEYDVEGLVERARRAGIPEDRIAAWRDRLPAEWVAAARRGRLAAYLLSWGLFQPDYFITAFDVEGSDAEARWRAMADVLTATIDDARSRGIEVAVAFLPNLYLYDAKASGPGSTFPFHRLGGTVRAQWATSTTEIQTRLAQWSHTADVPFLDLTDIFRRACVADCALHFPVDGHWNPEGHRVAAQALERWIRDRGLFVGPQP